MAAPHVTRPPFANRTPPAVARARPGLWCVDSLGAYLRLRDREIVTIDEAIEHLVGSRVPDREEFDAIADGLSLYLAELDDDARLEELDLETIEASLRS